MRVPWIFSPWGASLICFCLVVVTWEKVEGEDSFCMKDQLCLFSLCKWGDFAFRAWEWEWFYLISAKQQHMLPIFFLWIFCLDRDAVGEGSDVATETKMSLFLWKFRSTVS